MKTLRGDHDGGSLRIGIVVSRFNESVTDALLKGALEALDEAWVPSGSITVVSVPGAFEIAGAACKLAASGRVDAVVCLGAVIRGQTDHFTFVAAAAQEGILRVILDLGIPVTFGVLTTDDFEQAEARAGLGGGAASNSGWAEGKSAWAEGNGGRAEGNKGYEAALDAVEMANLYRLIQGSGGE